jgi:hypothetical protein
MLGPQVDSGGAMRGKKTFRRQFAGSDPDGERERYIGHPLYLGAKMTADEVL